MKFRNVNELVDMHCGMRAWIFGKGPGLDTFDRSKVDGPAICINESLLQVQSPSYFFAHDEVPIERVASRWPRNCCAVLQQPRAEFAASKGVPADRILVYEKRQCSVSDEVWQRSEILQSNSLIGLSGTVHTAIHFCHLIGIAAIMMVGFEGKGKYAASLNMEIPIGGGSHGRIRKEAERLLEQLNFDYEFFLSDVIHS